MISHSKNPWSTLMTKDTLSLEHTRTRRGSWLMGALVLIPAILLPPRTFFYLLLVSDMNLKSLFPFLMNYYPMPGGLAGQLFYYMRLTRINSADAGDFLMALVASCLATLSLTLCLMFFWRRLVDRKPRPTLLRVLLAVLVSVASSLVLTLILCSIESTFGNKESLFFAVLLTEVMLFIAHLILAPILFIGGAILVKRQARTESQAPLKM
jgi:hypothetical protein